MAYFSFSVDKKVFVFGNFDEFHCHGVSCAYCSHSESLMRLNQSQISNFSRISLVMFADHWFEILS